MELSCTFLKPLLYIMSFVYAVFQRFSSRTKSIFSRKALVERQPLFIHGVFVYGN